MDLLWIVLVALGLSSLIVGAVAAPWWVPGAWAKTVRRWSMNDHDRVYCEMLSDLVDEDCWTEDRYAAWTHKASGVKVDLWPGHVWVNASGEQRRFGEAHPAFYIAKRLKKRMKRAEASRASVDGLKGMNAAYRRMRDLH